MTQNVVTYTVEVDIDNYDGKLLPYLTANAEFETGRRNGVLLVPNAALRWTPRADQITPDLSAKSHNQPNQSSATVWILDGKFVRPIAVTAGLTDGTSTEVAG
jgi:HlyD family secretion protein